MDLDILSVREYSHGVRPIVLSVTPTDHSSRSAASKSAIESGRRRSMREKRALPKTMPRKRERQARHRSPSTDEAQSRQRGRPRIDVSDQTAGEVDI